MEIATKYDKIIFFEESVKNGGVAQKFACQLYDNGYKGEFITKAIENEFIEHASVDIAMQRCGLDKDSILELVRKETNSSET